MNGFKRASRRQAAVVGLAVLMGTSLLGCHAGPRLFSKNDRELRGDKKELAEQDKGKFINRKKVRSESDYLDDSDDQVAKKESKAKARPTDPARKPTASANERAVVARQQPDDEEDTSTRSAKSKSTGSQPKTSKSANQPEIARRDSTKRPVTDLLNDDSRFEDELPESRSTAKKATTSNSAMKSTVSKRRSLDDDPFKNSVIGPMTTQRSEKRVETVNFFDDEEVTDEIVEEADDYENLRAPAAKNNVAKSAVAAASPNRQVSPSQRKFLDEIDEPAAGSFRSHLRNEMTEDSNDEVIFPEDSPSVKHAGDAPKNVAEQKVIDRREQVQQTLDDWRREMDGDESSVNLEDKVDVSAPSTSLRTSSSPTAKGHLSQADIEEFAPPAKSQGAMLNGELIIDTNTLQSRFQRPTARPAEPGLPNGAAGRMNSNFGANIEITPGTTQNRTRPAGQISLQSAAELDAETGLTTANYEQTTERSDSGKLPTLRIGTDLETGPSLSVLDEKAEIAPPPPEELTDNNAGIGFGDSSSRNRVWKRTLLVLAAMASAVVIGFGLRRRMVVIPAPIRFSTQPRKDLQDPASWPRG